MSACSGRSQVFVTAVGYAGVKTPNRPMKKFAVVIPVIQKLSGWSFDPPRSLWTLFSKHSGKHTILHRACVRVTTSAPNTGRRYFVKKKKIGQVPRRSGWRTFMRHDLKIMDTGCCHDGNSFRRAVLLCRGVPLGSISTNIQTAIVV